MIVVQGRAVRVERWGVVIEVEKSSDEGTKVAVFFGSHAMRAKVGETVSIECYASWRQDANENWSLRLTAAEGYRYDAKAERWEEIEKVKIDRQNGNGKPQNGKPTNKQINKPTSPVRRKGEYMNAYDEEPDF